MADDSDGDSLIFFVLFCLFETGSFSHTDCRLPRNLLANSLPALPAS